MRKIYANTSVNDENIFLDEVPNVDSEYYEHEFLYDFMETIADYASGYLDNGYVYLSSYFIEDNELHGLYDYIDFDDNKVLDNIDFIIDLDLYASKGFAELNRYVNKFSRILGDEFSEVDK